MKKILILFCGGTIIMKKNTDGALVPPEKEEAMECLLNIEPQILEQYDIDIEYIANIDSTNITPQHWEQMAQAILKNYKKYDGFVITHGTDSMAYTANALSFALQNLGKPVILTGAQISGRVLGTDAKNNLINAILLATQDIAGVYLVFGKHIILGTRSSKVSVSNIDAFASINAEDAGSINIQMTLTKNLPKRNKNAILELKIGFESNIAIITLTPGNNPNYLDHLIETNGLKGLIIRGFGPGNIPYAYYPVLHKAQQKKVPILVLSQCLHGVTSMREYDVGLKALEYGVIEGKDMSLEAASTKLMWALHHYPYEEIKSVFEKNFTGEICLKSEKY